VHPYVFGVPAYDLSWLTAAAVCVPFALRHGAAAGLPRLPVALVGVQIALALLLGAKALYFVERAFFPGEDPVPAALRGTGGLRIAGGVALVYAALPFMARATRLPWRRLADAIAIPFFLAIAIVRLGCFLNGCCFGAPSSSPWGVSFPSGTWAFAHQVSQGLSYPIDSHTPPLHPTQLYVVMAAATAAGVAHALRGRTAVGIPWIAGGSVLFAGMALAESFRAPRCSVIDIGAPASAAVLALVAAALWRSADRGLEWAPIGVGSGSAAQSEGGR